MPLRSTRDVGVVERDEVVARRQLGDLVEAVLVGDRGLRLRSAGEVTMTVTPASFSPVLAS